MSDEKLSREVLERLSRELIGYAHHKFGGRVGITLFCFEFGDAGKHIAYISNTERQQMIATVKEWLANVEAGLYTDPPGERPEG